MNGFSDVSMSRDDLWRRLEGLNYFDWCRKAEYKQLRALFFEGEVVDYPEEFITCRELFWSPKQGEEHWRATIEARKAYLDFDGQRQVSEGRGEEFVAGAVNHLLQSDFQYVGMSVDCQLSLLAYLGLEHYDASNGVIYIERWLSSIKFWLKCRVVVSRLEISPVADCPSAHRRDFFYKLLASVPVDVLDGKLTLQREVDCWSETRVQDLNESLLELSRLLISYRVPEDLQCDGAPRMSFVEAMLEDLESENAPELFRHMWQSTLARQDK